MKIAPRHTRIPEVHVAAPVGPTRAMSDRALVHALDGFFRTNAAHSTPFRELLENTLAHGGLDALYTEEGQVHQDLRVVRHPTFQAFQEAYWGHKVTRYAQGRAINVITHQQGDRTYELIKLDCAHPGADAISVVRLGDWLSLENEYNWQTNHDLFFKAPRPSGAHDLRSKLTFAVKVNSKGDVVGRQEKQAHLIDLYPHDTVVLTRTLSKEEESMWLDPSTPADAFGSEFMQGECGFPFPPVSFATGAYWNDHLVWVEGTIAVEVPTAAVAQWVDEGRVFLTPLGEGHMMYTDLKRPVVDDSIARPFELVTKDPSVNAQIRDEAVRQANESPSPRLEPYLETGVALANLAVPLGPFFSGALGVPSLEQVLGDRELAREFHTEATEIAAMRPDDPHARERVLNLVERLLSQYASMEASTQTWMQTYIHEAMRKLRQWQEDQRSVPRM